MENAFEHHGVLGQKWGVRRYQPYPKGHVGGKEIGAAAKVEQRSTKTKSTASAIKKKKLSEVSEVELREKINRLQLEQQYIDLMRRRKAPDVAQKKGENIIKDILKTSTKVAGTQVATFVIGYLLNTAIKEAFHTDLDIVNIKKK